MTLKQVFAALGGPRKIAAKLGDISHQAVSQWSSADRVPDERKRRLREMCVANSVPVHAALRGPQ